MLHLPASSMNSSVFRIEYAEEKDIPEMVSLIVPAFQFVPVEAILNGKPTPENLLAAEKRHRYAWRKHMESYSLPCAIKCIHRDPATGTETIVGAALWHIYNRERTEEEYMAGDYLLSGDWLTDVEAKKKVKGFMQPVVDMQAKWMGSRPHAALHYMCVQPAWRRRGISSICVRWGLERCKELGIPAYLEASEEGAPVYARLGFETVDSVTSLWEGAETSFPIMVWWPEGMKVEDRLPAASRHMSNGTV